MDQLYGKPSGAWKRTQVILVLLFWISRISRGNRNGPRLPFLRRLNRLLSRFTPWQIVVSTLTLVYAVKNGDAIFGLSAPEPLARLYSRNYYRCVRARDLCYYRTSSSFGYPQRDMDRHGSRRWVRYGYEHTVEVATRHCFPTLLGILPNICQRSR